MPLLRPGDTFPALTLTVPGGETVTVPDAFAGQFGVLLFYRGSWCASTPLPRHKTAGQPLAKAVSPVRSGYGPYFS